MLRFDVIMKTMAMKTETHPTATVSRGVTGGHESASTRNPRQKHSDATEFVRNRRTPVNSDHVEPPCLSLHLPPEHGHAAAEVSRFLPNLHLVDSMSFLETFCIGIILMSAIAIHFWQVFVR
jgi:hypothetical protein